MSWIKVIPFSEATGSLKAIYNKIKGPKNQIDNVLSIHSLRPHTLTGHMSLYKNTLHHSANSFPNWFLELLGTYTSYINDCDYCYEHHFHGMKRFLNDDNKAQLLKKHIENNTLKTVLDSNQFALVSYAKSLTLDPSSIKKETIENLKSFGYTDGEILEVNQVVAYFNYANRTVLGLSPSNKDDVDAWNHK